MYFRLRNRFLTNEKQHLTWVLYAVILTFKKCIQYVIKLMV